MTGVYPSQTFIASAGDLSAEQNHALKRLVSSTGFAQCGTFHEILIT
jgi:hypothetical protein